MKNKIVNGLMTFCRYYITVLIVCILPLISGFSQAPCVALTPDEFYKKLQTDDNALILDARLYEDYYEERLPNALWAGEKKDLMMVLKGMPKERSIYLYCYKGDKRGMSVADILQKEGYYHVFFLKGGIFQWLDEGLETEKTPPR